MYARSLWSSLCSFSKPAALQSKPQTKSDKSSRKVSRAKGKSFRSIKTALKRSPQPIYQPPNLGVLRNNRASLTSSLLFLFSLGFVHFCIGFVASNIFDKARFFLYLSKCIRYVCSNNVCP